MGRPSSVQVTGPLAPYSDGFRSELARQGFRDNSACNQLQLMAHASRWLAGQALDVGDLTPAPVKDFLDARRAEGYTLWLSPKAMVPMLGYLRGIGVVATPVPAGPSTPAEKLIEAYRAYLVQERGLAAGTVADYLHVARLFLATRPTDGGLGLERLTAAEVSAFVLAECTTRRVGSAKSIVAGLRSLLRYLYVSGRTKTQLAAAVPKVAGWRLAGLPKAISPGDVDRLLASCDRRSTFGRRDFAVLAIFARLGLRSGEVAALELADIDWRAGEIVVRGKGRRQERLPLPVDVGEAIAGWLRRGRPRCESTKVFTRVRAPHEGLSRSGVSAIVVSAGARAGLPAVHAHRLRHTAATEMLRAGASLAEIGQVLRHVSVLTTAIYAKVDRSGLRALALPWPGLES
jgi:site-specific recombinase XerD